MHIREYIRSLNASGLSPSSIARRFSSIKTYHKYLSAENLVKKNPTLVLSSPKNPRKLPNVLSVVDVEAIIEAILENNIQAALGQQGINLEDAIDLRQIRNVKLANQMLKLRRKKKGEMDHQREIEKTAAQGAAQANAAQASSQAEIAKNEAMFETQRKLKELESQMAQTLLAQETSMKKDLSAQDPTSLFNLSVRIIDLTS